MAAIQL